MPNKKKIALRLNLEDSNALKKWAADEYRSLNGHIEYLLHKALTESGRISNNLETKKSAKNNGNE